MTGQWWEGFFWGFLASEVLDTVLWILRKHL